VIGGLRPLAARDVSHGARSHGYAAFVAAAGVEGFVVRPATAADEKFIAEVYATTREEELRQVAWTDAQKRAFTDWQSAQQERHYATHYPDAERLILVAVAADGAATHVGRIYVDTTPADVRLMEMTLLPAWRNRGIGSRLLEQVIAYADRLGRDASLHVEPFNPAKRMYERAGFAVVETRGLYEFMVRPAPILRGGFRS